MTAGAITDIPGLRVGHFTETRRPTGCTVVLLPPGTVAGVAVQGAAPGTRETDLLQPGTLVEHAHAILLSGGSAFGLDAATGVMRWLEAQGAGFPAGPALVPIVPAAVLFDLGVGDPAIRPDAAAGHAACEAATAAPPAEGRVGAGAGCTVGKLLGPDRAAKGGIGTASLRVDGITVGALIAVNAVGDVIDPATGALAAGPGAAAALLGGAPRPGLPAGTATTIGVVATDAVLTKAQAHRLALQAHDGLARAIEPAHTLWDGDTIFAAATGGSGRTGDPLLLGLMAARVTAAAILRAVQA